MLVSTAGRRKGNAQIVELGLACFLARVQLARYQERALPSEPKEKADNYQHVIKEAVLSDTGQHSAGSTHRHAWLLQRHHSPLQSVQLRTHPNGQPVSIFH